MSVLHYYAPFRPVGCALGTKFESCDWCPAPPSSNGFFAALVFGGELPNGLLFEIAAGFIHQAQLSSAIGNSGQYVDHVMLLCLALMHALACGVDPGNFRNIFNVAK